MTNEYQPLLETLSQWSKLEIADTTEENQPIGLADNTVRLYQITLLKRGTAQQLPASILQPV